MTQKERQFFKDLGIVWIVTLVAIFISPRLPLSWAVTILQVAFILFCFALVSVIVFLIRLGRRVWRMRHPK